MPEAVNRANSNFILKLEIKAVGRSQFSKKFDFPLPPAGRELLKALLHTFPKIVGKKARPLFLKEDNYFLIPTAPALYKNKTKRIKSGVRGRFRSSKLPVERILEMQYI